MNKIFYLFISITMLVGIGSLQAESEIFSDCVLIRYKAGTSLQKQKMAVGSRAETGKFLQARLNRPSVDPIFDELASIKIGPNESIENVISELKNKPDILYAEKCPVYKNFFVPNDEFFDLQWGLHNVGQDGGVVDSDIDAPEAWDKKMKGETIIVGIIDSGVDYNHPDLAPHMWINEGEIPGNNIDDDGNGYIDDVHGYDFYAHDNDPMDEFFHGTHVAGIIGAVRNNNVGVAGVAQNIKLMPVRFLGSDGSGNSELGPVLSIEYAMVNGAKVLNNSWGGTIYSQVLQDVINVAVQSGVVFIAAAGNSNSASLQYPAAMNNVITVAATDQSDRRAVFSSFGSWVDVSAPGEHIYSTVLNGEYDYKRGTSMATPFVTGVAAMVLSRHPQFGHDDIKEIIRYAVDPVNSLEPIGAGRINAAKALEVEFPLPDARLMISNSQITQDRFVTFSGNASGKGFYYYVLEYGGGYSPNTWTEFYRSKNPILNGNILENFDASVFGEGITTVRLRVFNQADQYSEDRLFVEVDLMNLVQPRNNDVYGKGQNINIMASINIPFHDFVLEWGHGKNPQTWRSDGLETIKGVTGSGNFTGEIGVWNTGFVYPDAGPMGDFYRLRVTLQTQTGPRYFYGNMIHMSDGYKEGWPQKFNMSNSLPFVEGQHIDVKVSDLNKDGQNEILATIKVSAVGLAYHPVKLNLYTAQGKLLWSKDLKGSKDDFVLPVIGDLDGDGFQEIVVNDRVGIRDTLHVYRYDGSEWSGNWPLSLTKGQVVLVLADMNQDGRLEIIAKSNSPSSTSKIFIINHEGIIINEFTVNTGSPGYVLRPSLPVVGNFDDDPELEIATILFQRDLVIYKQNGTILPGWPKNLGANLLANTIAVGDVDRDGKEDLVVAGNDFALNIFDDGVFVFDRHGNLLPGWPVRGLMTEEMWNGNPRPVNWHFSPALADFNRDGYLEIVLVGDSNVFVLDYTGAVLPGWPRAAVKETAIRGGAVIGDVNGDGVPDIVVCTDGLNAALYSEENYTNLGGVFAWDINGTPIDLNPIFGFNQLFTDARAEHWVGLNDIDRDGKLDIIATSLFGHDVIPNQDGSVVSGMGVKKAGQIYIWKTNQVYKKANMPWPMFQRDNHHSGRYQRLWINPSVIESKSEGLAEQALPVSPDGQPYARNKFNPIRGEDGQVDVNLSEAGPVEVMILDRSGNNVVGYFLKLSAGINRISWDGRDQDGDVVPSGVYHVRVQAAQHVFKFKLIVSK